MYIGRQKDRCIDKQKDRQNDIEIMVDRYLYRKHNEILIIVKAKDKNQT